MKKIVLMILTVSFLLPSCISQKKYAALEAMNQQSKDLLNSATVKLNTCIDEKAGAEADLKTLKEQVSSLKRSRRVANGNHYMHTGSPIQIT